MLTIKGFRKKLYIYLNNYTEFKANKKSFKKGTDFQKNFPTQNHRRVKSFKNISFEIIIKKQKQKTESTLGSILLKTHEK